MLDKATGEFICKEAEEIYNRFKTAGAYIEVSPSGSGLRIICKASSPLVKFGNGRGEFSKFEIYGNGDGGLHFLSITEDVLQAVDKLIDCTSKVNWFHETCFKKPDSSTRAWDGVMSPPLEDAEIIEKMRRYKRKAEFTELFDVAVLVITATTT